MNCLLIVDVQPDFCPGGPLAVEDGHAVVPVINAWMPDYPLVGATQDWHPADHLSFASQHPGRRPGDTVDLDGLAQVLWPDHCVQGTPGAALHPDLDVRPLRAIFRKGTRREVDSYSGCFDNGHRHRTGLLGWLRDLGVTDVDVVGLATDWCVKATALDLAAHGLRTRVLLEGCRAVAQRPQDLPDALAALRRAGVTVM